MSYKNFIVTMMTDNKKSRELSRRAKRKEKLKSLNLSPKKDNKKDDWYMRAYQRFSIFLRVSRKIETTSDF